MPKEFIALKWPPWPEWPHNQDDGMGEKSKLYWWVSVAGASCEPAVVVVEEGVRRAYTIGCADAFRVDDPECPLKLIKQCDKSFGIPLTPSQEARQQRKQEKAMQELRSHGYRRF